MPSFVDKIQMKINKKDVTIVDTDGSLYRKATGVLSAVDTAGGVFAWVNPTGGHILVRHVVLNVTKASTDVCTVDVGVTGVSVATASDNLIDGVSVAAIARLTNDESAGVNGKSFKTLAPGKWVTGSKATGATAGIAGTYTIYYDVL